MSTALPLEMTPRKPLRLWPGVVAVLLQWLLRFVVPALFPEAGIFGVLGGLFCGLLVVVWWLFFSRAAWAERLGAIILILVALFVTSRLVHVSIANGMMGMMLFIYAVPVVSLAFVAWAVVTRSSSNKLRHWTMLATVLVACGVFTLLRTGGITGNGSSELKWRWTKSSEEILLSRAKAEPGPLPTPMPTVKKGFEWPGFRGPERDGILRGVKIATDWSRSPPVQLWRARVGPGWSSFAIRDDFFYTQEQRGDDEEVACYKIITGEPVWRHRDPVRFWESNGGAGPRGTPTLSTNRLYAFGATGILNALDVSNGGVVWSRNVASDSATKVPGWGFSSSPLVVGEVVIVAAAGKLAAYDIVTGNPRWFGPAHGGSYSSPHRLTIDGVTQVLLPSDAGLTSVAPADGKVLWEYSWPGVTILQPALIAGGDILVSTGGAAGGVGTRRVTVSHGKDAWTVQERWTSTGLKPYFNDFVIHNGHAYGFDGSIIACIGLEDGKRRWKDGRYGNGQLVLLADQGVLIVLSEQGEVAMVAATPDGFRELGRFTAIEGKTWNHPVVAGDVLLVRNGQEMAAFRLMHSDR
jgi:outer membrane protein assembly factor BamB